MYCIGCDPPVARCEARPAIRSSGGTAFSCHQTVAKRMDGKGQWRMFGEPKNDRQTLSNMPRRTRVDGDGLGPERIPKQRVGGSNPLSRSRPIKSRLPAMLFRP